MIVVDASVLVNALADDDTDGDRTSMTDVRGSRSPTCTLSARYRHLPLVERVWERRVGGFSRAARHAP